MTNKTKAYERTDGRFECRIFLGKDDNGKRQYKSFYGRTPDEAIEKRSLFVRSMTAEPEIHMGTVFSTVAEEWLSSKNMDIKRSTYANYRMKLDKHLLPYFGDKKITDISAKMVYDFMNEKKSAGKSIRYVSDILIVLKAIFKYAARTYGIKNAFDHITMPKCRRSEVPILSDDEINRLIKALSGTHDRKNLAVLIAIYLGLRIGEICGLKWSDVDFAEKLLYVNRTVQRIQTKGGKRKTEVVVGEPKSEKSKRAIPLSDELIKLLEMFRSDDDNFIISDKTKPVEPRTLQYHFAKILKNGNYSSVTFHSLRHAFATKALASGCGMKTLSEIMGHSTVEVTMSRYAHSTIEIKRACMENINWAS